MVNSVDEKYHQARIMLIDDDPAVCAGQAFRLHYRHGFERIIQHIKPDEALAELKQNPDAADVVLLDLKMPEIDGFSVLARIKSINPSIQIIIFSAFTGLDEVRKVLSESKMVFEFCGTESSQAKPAILEKANEKHAERLPEIICQAYDAHKRYIRDE